MYFYFDWRGVATKSAAFDGGFQQAVHYVVEAKAETIDKCRDLSCNFEVKLGNLLAYLRYHIHRLPDILNRINLLVGIQQISSTYLDQIPEVDKQ